jgi:integrase
MPKHNLTDRTLQALKPAADGTRYEYRDAVVPGLLVRVTDSGTKTFMLQHRFPGSKQPTRRAIGIYGACTLESARRTARDWLEMIRNGIDPAVQKERERLEAQRRAEHSFAAVAEEYLKRHVIGPNPAKPRQRAGWRVELAFRNLFIPMWGKRQITDIARLDVLKLIESLRDHGINGTLANYGLQQSGDSRPAPAHARNLFGCLQTFFSWAVERDTHGLQSSPCDHIRPRRIIGKLNARDRILDDDELLAFWRAVEDERYPFEPAYKLLLLTGLRKNEVAGARWSEFDLKKGLWTIPADRMKAKNDEARPHVVPITADMREILDSLPRFTKGEYLFSTKAGAAPVHLATLVKQRVDAGMLATLRKLARSRDEDPAKVKLTPWVNHDLRRTVRSRLSKLRIDRDVGEAVLAHAKPGVHGVYDRHDLLDEKRHALELWATRLRSIINPQPNVVELARARQ